MTHLQLVRPMADADQLESITAVDAPDIQATRCLDVDIVGFSIQTAAPCSGIVGPGSSSGSRAACS
jgi:hypothetical protein